MDLAETQKILEEPPHFPTFNQHGFSSTAPELLVERWSLREHMTEGWECLCSILGVPTGAECGYGRLWPIGFCVVLCWGWCVVVVGELQTRTIEGPGASNTTKIHEKTPRETKRAKMEAGEREKSAKFLGSDPSGPPFAPSSPFGGPKFRRATFFWVWAPPFRAPLFSPSLLGPSRLAKYGLKWIGEESIHWPKSVSPDKNGAKDNMEVERTTKIYRSRDSARNTVHASP